MAQAARDNYKTIRELIECLSSDEDIQASTINVGPFVEDGIRKTITAKFPQTVLYTTASYSKVCQTMYGPSVMVKCFDLNRSILRLLLGIQKSLEGRVETIGNQQLRLIDLPLKLYFGDDNSFTMFYNPAFAATVLMRDGMTEDDMKQISTERVHIPADKNTKKIAMEKLVVTSTHELRWNANSLSLTTVSKAFGAPYCLALRMYPSLVVVSKDDICRSVDAYGNSEKLKTFLPSPPVESSPPEKVDTLAKLTIQDDGFTTPKKSSKTTESEVRSRRAPVKPPIEPEDDEEEELNYDDVTASPPRNARVVSSSRQQPFETAQPTRRVYRK